MNHSEQPARKDRKLSVCILVTMIGGILLQTLFDRKHT